MMFPFLDPRSGDIALGLAIGLSLALAVHWIGWILR